VSRSAPAGPFLRWRPLSFLLFGAGAALLVGAVVDRSAVPVFLAVPLLLAGPAAALGGPRGPPVVRVERHEEGSGPDVRVVGSLRASDRTDARDLELSFDRPAALAAAAEPTFEPRADAVGFSVPWLAAEPAIVEIPAPRVVWRDACGLVERPVRSEGGPLVVERYPPELVHVGAVRLRRTMALPGETPSSRLGASGEFHGLRDAAPSDPPRRINWRASARAGRLVANEYEVDRTGDVLLLLDARRTSLGPEVDDRLFSIARAAAAGIAESFLHEKARVGVAVFGEFLDAVPLASGRTQRLRVRARLLDARLGPADTPSERGAIAVSRYFPPGVTTILLTSLVDDPSGELVLHLRRRGYPLIVLSPSPLPILTAQSALPATDEALAARLTALVRRARIAQTWRDAPTVDWDQYWSLGGFVHFLRRAGTARVG